MALAPTLSCDIISLNSGDLFSQIRQGLGFKRWADAEALNLSGRDPDRVSTTALEALALVDGQRGRGHGSRRPDRQPDARASRAT